MSQQVTHTNFNDGTTSRRFTAFPLNSTLVSAYTTDTIRSIITQASAGQPYSTPVWIRVSQAGIQVTAQDAQIARTRIPVFIPIGLIHDIFMLPSINNVICIVYDEVQSNTKGILLYVCHPSDAQAIREDFRIVKQSPQDSRSANPQEIYPVETTQFYTPLSTKSPLFNDQTIRQSSPRRVVYIRDNEINSNREITPALPQLNYLSSKGSYHSDHHRHRSPRKHRSRQSPTKRWTDTAFEQERRYTSRSPDKRVRTKLPVSRSSPDLVREQNQQQQQQLLVQQAQMAAWQAGQQAPLIPMGMYNRYVPKTIPLPTGETLKTTLPPPGMGGPAANGIAMAFVEPLEPMKLQQPNRSRSRSTSPSTHERHHLPTGQSPPQHRRHRRRHHTAEQNSHSSRIRSKNLPPVNDIADDETKEYFKMLADEMQAMKLEMNRLRQAAAAGGTPNKERTNSLQVDLKEIRSNIDVIRSRIAMTPRIMEK